MMRLDYLQAMDITVWRPRVVAPESPAMVVAAVPSLDCHSIQLAKAGQPVAWLLADQGDQVAEERQLLAAICQAMKLEVTWQPLPDPIDTGVRLIILLGERVAEKCLLLSQPIAVLRKTQQEWKALVAIVSHAPATLLNQPGLKRETWQDLQSGMTILSV